MPSIRKKRGGKPPKDKPPVSLADSPVIRRLIEEVKAEKEQRTGYGRTYHRHNRS